MSNLSRNDTPWPGESKEALEERGLKRWWVSWYSVDDFEYDGPCWVTGSRMSDDADTICAAVIAADAEGARKVILDAHEDPGLDLEWRFVDERPADWHPFNDRFQA